jgi:hypothetical protein
MADASGFDFSLAFQFLLVRMTIRLNCVFALLTTRTEGKTGKPKCSPSTPGLTPPTIVVPHSNDSLAFAVALKGISSAPNTRDASLGCPYLAT